MRNFGIPSATPPLQSPRPRITWRGLVATITVGTVLGVCAAIMVASVVLR